MRTVILVSGPSGVGKGTIVIRVLDKIPEVQIGRSLTTRPRRDDDTMYDYATVEEFHAAFDRGELLERNEVYGKVWYGKRVPPTDGVWILELDVEGAVRAKQQIPEALWVLIVPPGDSIGVLRERLIGRGASEDEAEIRIARANYEIGFGREHEPDLVIVNDSVDRAVEVLANFILQAMEPTR